MPSLVLGHCLLSTST